MSRPKVDTRGEILSLLSNACDVEHTLACAYLYAAMSLKSDLTEEGMTWGEHQRVRRWAAQLFFVASQEMLHLAQAWNLLIAVGGAPWFQRDPFPVTLRGLGVVELRPFSDATLTSFVAFEKMSNNIAAPPPPGPRVDDDLFLYSTVGELYGLLEQGIRSFPEAELFVGGASPQLGPETAHFPDLLRVRDRASALEAIHRIRHQGEGTSNDDTDCHHGIFAAILAEVGATTAANASFAPVRATSTPVPGAPSGGPHEKAGKLFDDVYLLLLRMMAWGTAADPVDAAETARFAGASIEMMVTVLKPLGDRMFGTAAHPGPGPSFGLGRVLALPGSAATASRIVAEQLGSLAARVERTHAENGWSPGRVPEALRRIAARFG